MRFLRVVLALFILASFGLAKSDIQFGKNTYLGKNSFIFDVVNSGISSGQVGQITHKPLIVCDHNLTGFIEYTSKTKFTFFYDKPIIKGVKYSCHINPKYSNKKSKTAIYTNKFHVKLVTFTAPNTINIKFRDRVSNEEVLKNITLEKVNKLAKSKLGYKIERSDGINFLLRTDEDTNKVVFHVSDKMKSIHGQKIQGEWHPVLSDEELKYKVDKNTKSLAFYDEPSWGVGKNGKIVLRVFVKEYFNVNDNIRNFIKINGVKNFTISNLRWTNYDMRKKYNLHEKSWNYFDIVGDFKPNTTYKIEFLKGFGRQSVQFFEDKTYSVRTGDFGRYVGFDNDKKPYISSFGELGITSVNVDKINIVIDKMMNQNLRYMLNFNNELDLGTASKEVVNKTFTIGGKKNVYTKHKIPLKEALNGLKSGVYGISIHYGKDKYAYKKVFLSDIGLGAKVHEDGIFVWTASLKDTTSYANAKVEVFSSSNMLIASGNTNQYGVFEFKKKDFLSKNPKSLIVTKGDEQNFLILSNPIGDANLYNIKNSKNLYNAYVYFQSELIRPDEDISALVVLKDRDYKSLKNAPIKVVLKDPIGKTIYEKAFKTDKNGAFTITHSLKGQKSGQYSFLVYFADKLKANKSFFVEAFLPQKVKNEIVLPNKDIKTNSIFEVEGRSNYLFGSPAAFMKGNFRLKAVGKDFISKEYKDFTFSNQILKEKNVITYMDEKKNITLDKNGVAIALLSTNIKQLPPSILEGQVEFSVLDDGRNVSAYKSIDIYPFSAMVGLDIQKSILDTDIPVQIDTLLLNPLNGKKLDAKLDVFVYKNSWYYTYDSNGFYKWNQERKRVEHFTINAGERIERVFSSSGDYIIEVKDSLSMHSATVDFSVRGWDYASLSPTNKISKNQVKYEDKLYKKGETVKLDIKSPIKKGKMLVSLEGRGVLWYEVIPFEKGRLKADVPLDWDLKDGLYIHTIAIRDSKTPSSLIPFRASSSSFIKPDRSLHEVKPVINAKDVTMSNTTIPISIKAKPNSSLLVSVVDDGILQILGQEPPNPFKFFTRKPKDKVADFDIYDLLLNYATKGKKLNFGSGAMALAKSKKHLSPKTGAKRVKPFVYFSKLISIGDSGEVSVDLKVPSSYNGSATIAVIEVGSTQVGASSKKLIVKDDVIIKPIYPRYGNVGDRWSIPVRVFNTTKKSLDVALDVQTNKLLKAEKFEKSLTLKPNSSKLVSMKMEVEGFGKGEVKIVAKTKDKTFSYDVELPLIYPYPLDTFNLQGESKTVVDLKAPDIYMKGFTPSFTLSVSGDVLARLRGGSDYLIGYPYGCAEQTSSKLLAMLKMKDFLSTKNEDVLKAKLNDRKRFINEGISKLANMQKNDGRFGYWDVNSYVNTYASIYASDILYDLKQNGENVPSFVLEGVKKSLKEFSNLQDSNNYFNKIYATYLLATQNIIDPSNINTIYDKKLYQTNLPSLYMMAYIFKKARMDSEMNAVLKQAYAYDFVSLEKRKREYGRYFYSYPKDIAFALYLHVKYFAKNKASDELLRRVKKEFKNLYSTQDKAFALRAISEYFKDYKKGKNEFVITGGGVDEIYDFEANLGGKFTKNKITITPKQNWINYDFSVMQYLPKPIKHELVLKSKKPLNIYREFVDEKGNGVDLSKLKMGQLIYSKIKVFANEDMKNVVVNEQVPSCFEIVNERINKIKRGNNVQNSKSYRPDFVDIRDDKTLTFLSLENNKIVTFLTPLRATTRGVCKLPAVLTEAMYDERIKDYDLSKNDVVIK